MLANAVVAGRLSAIEPGYIVLGDNSLRIAVPAGLSTDLPIGSRLTVLVQNIGDSFIATSIQQSY